MSRRYRDRDESSFEKGFGVTCGCLAAIAVVFCLIPLGVLTVGFIAGEAGRERRQDSPPTKKTEPARLVGSAPKKDRKP